MSEGDLVLVTAGSFVGFRGEVVSVTDETADVRFNIFGRVTDAVTII